MSGIKNKRIISLKELALQGPTLVNGLAVGAMVDVWSMDNDGQVFCCLGVLAALRLTAHGVHEFSVGFMLQTTDMAAVLDDVFGVICEPGQINAEQALILLSDPKAPDTIMLYKTDEGTTGAVTSTGFDGMSSPPAAMEDAVTPAKTSHLKMVASNSEVAPSDTPTGSPELRAVDSIDGTSA